MGPSGFQRPNLRVRLQGGPSCDSAPVEHEQYEIPAGSVEADFLAWRSNGDGAALERVFDAVAPDLLKLGLHLVGQAADAEDLVQQTFLAALQNPGSWVPGRPLRPFLTTILRRRAIDAHRRNRPTEELDLQLDWIGEQVAPDDEAMAAEMSAELAKALDGLREPYRRAMLLRLRHGMRSADIAHVLNLSPGAVRMRLSRGTELLRGLLPAALGAVLASLPLSGRGLAAVREATLASAAELAPLGAAPELPEGSTASSAVRPLSALMGQAGLGWLVLGAPLVLALLVLMLDDRSSDVETRGGAAELAKLSEGPRGAGAALEEDMFSGGGRYDAAVVTTDLYRARGTEAQVALGVLTVKLEHGGKPRSGVVVELLDTARSASGGLLLAETDARGSVRFEGLAAGCYRVTAGNGLRRRVMVEAGEENVELFESGFPLRVHVAVLRSDGLPVPGARIEARDRARAWFEIATTDGAGRCEIELAERPPVLRAVAEGYCHDGGCGVPDLTSPDQPLILGLQAGGASFAVHVRNADGSELGAARLRMGRAASRREPRFGGNGLPTALPDFKEFELIEMSSPERRVEALQPGQYWVLAEGANSGAAAAVFDLGVDEHVFLEFVLPSSTHVVVRAYDFASLPVAGAELWLQSDLGGDRERGKTDEGGELRLKGLLPGLWTVYAEGDDVALGTARVGLETGAVIDVLVERLEVLDDRELGSLIVRTPQPGAGVTEFALPRLELFAPDGRHMMTRAFGAERLELAGLVPGTYSARVLAVACAPRLLSDLQVIAGEVREVDAGELELGGYVWLTSREVHSLSLTRGGEQVAAGRVQPGSPLLLGPLEAGSIAIEVGTADGPPVRFLDLRPGERLEVQL